MTNELKRVYTYNGGVTAVLKTPIVITDTTAYYRIGQSPRVWIGSTFKVFSDASGTTQYVLGVDYVLDQHYVDIDISKQVGEACYSYLKFIKEARTIYVDMDVVGSHVDGAIINELIENDEALAEAITDIESDITAINNKNNEQDLRLSAAETVNNAQNATLDDHEARLDNLSNVTNDAQLKRAAGDLNSFAQKTVLENSDVVIIEDASDGYTKKKVNANQFAVLGGGGGDVFGPASSVSDDIALFDGATGKLLKDSGRKLNTGAVAGTVPVRDANGKVPGSITGDAASVGGMYPDNIMASKTLAVTDLNNAILEGTYPMGAASSYTNHPGAAYDWGILVVHRAGNYVYQELQSVIDKTRNIRRTRSESTWSSWTIPQAFDLLPYGSNLNNILHPGTWRIGDAAQYSNIPSVASYSILEVLFTDLYVVQRLHSVTGGRTFYRFRTETTWSGSWYEIGDSLRGLKNMLYAVNWTINISNPNYFTIHQAVAAKRGGTGQIWLQGTNCEAGGGTILLSPGVYNVYGSPITLNIQYSPSQTQSDIIMVW